MKRKRFLVRSLAQSMEGTRIGLIKFIQILGKGETGTIVVPAFQNLQHSALVDVLGDIAKNLIKNRLIELDDDKKINLCSHSTLKNYKYSDSYLVLWCEKSTISEIELLSSWKSVVLVTFSPTDSERWEEKYDVAIVNGEK
uniref:hypothetical protein n=1 Tax=Xanthomonas sp. 0924 TaxID=2835534 RepID=UPI003F7E3929